MSLSAPGSRQSVLVNKQPYTSVQGVFVPGYIQDEHGIRDVRDLLNPDVANTPTPYFTEPGHKIVLLGETTGHLGGSAYWTYVLGTAVGAPPPVDLDRERRLKSGKMGSKQQTRGIPCSAT